MGTLAPTKVKLRVSCRGSLRTVPALFQDPVLIDGPNSDLYLLDLPSGEITRLTSVPLQVYELNWAPDEAWIVHLDVDTFGTGAGWRVDTLWAAASDGSSVLKLYGDTRMTFVEAYDSLESGIALSPNRVGLIFIGCTKRIDRVELLQLILDSNNTTGQQN